MDLSGQVTGIRSSTGGALVDGLLCGGVVVQYSVRDSCRPTLVKEIPPMTGRILTVLLISRVSLRQWIEVVSFAGVRS